MNEKKVISIKENQTQKIISKLNVNIWNIIDTTQCYFQSIMDSHQNIFIKEWLARPNPEMLGLYHQDVKDWENLQVEATKKLLILLEESNNTFLLFKHMLSQLKIEHEKHPFQKYKLSINAYSTDVENKDFLDLIYNCSFSDRIIIELTEKEPWSDLAIERLQYIQKSYGVELAMDDINPIASDENHTMESLDKLKKLDCFMNEGKIDGPYFQYLFQSNNYTGLKQRIKSDLDTYKIKKFIIEWIESQEQFDFAKKLEWEIEFKQQGLQFWYQWYFFWKG